MAFTADSKTILIAIPIRIGSFYAQIIRSFERYVSSYGYRVVSTTIGHLEARNAGPDFESILSYPISGLILVDLPESFQPTIKELCPTGWPIISVGAFTLDSMDTVSIRLDAGVTEAMNCLLSRTKGRIAFYGPGINDEMSVLRTFASDADHDPRLAIYTKLMKENKRAVEIISGNPGNQRESATALRQFISEYDCPDAIFCFHDEMAITANSVLRDLGIKVPSETLLVGCDGLAELEIVTPSLSTIDQPKTSLCARSLELLERRMKTPDAPLQHLILDAVFVERESTAR